MMVLINNWDMKDDNNAILATKGVTDFRAALHHQRPGRYLWQDRRHYFAQP